MNWMNEALCYIFNLINDIYKKRTVSTNKTNKDRQLTDERVDVFLFSVEYCQRAHDASGFVQWEESGGIHLFRVYCLQFHTDRVSRIHVLNFYL